MSGSARFDIRLPIGGLFVVRGAVLSVYGFATRSDAHLYARSENIAINLWWGIVMLVFGGLMFYFGRRAKERPPVTPSSHHLEPAAAVRSSP